MRLTRGSVRLASARVKYFRGTGANLPSVECIVRRVGAEARKGSARKGSKEFRRYLDIARGSLAEVESALDLARELEYIDATEYARLGAIATETAKTLWGLLRKVGDTATRYPTP